MYGPPVDLSFKNITRLPDTLAEMPRKGQRPLYLDSNGRYQSRAFRLCYNNLTDIAGLQFVLHEFLSEPSNLGWLDLSFNKLSYLDNGVSDLTDLRVLYLHGNCIWNMEELKKLSMLPHLCSLTLHGNPIEANPNYRNDVIVALPQLKMLDFCAVTQNERLLANVRARRCDRG